MSSRLVTKTDLRNLELTGWSDVILNNKLTVSELETMLRLGDEFTEANIDRIRREMIKAGRKDEVYCMVHNSIGEENQNE